MRAWRFTFALGFLAAFAALVAPRLLATGAPDAPQTPAIQPSTIQPAVHRPMSTLIPEVPAVPSVPMVPIVPVRVETPPAVPEVPTLPPHTWDDCPGCGMG